MLAKQYAHPKRECYKLQMLDLQSHWVFPIFLLKGSFGVHTKANKHNFHALSAVHCFGYLQHSFYCHWIFTAQFLLSDSQAKIPTNVGFPWPCKTRKLESLKTGDIDKYMWQIYLLIDYKFSNIADTSVFAPLVNKTSAKCWKSIFLFLICPFLATIK